MIGVSECSQQRGNLKDDGYNTNIQRGKGCRTDKKFDNKRNIQTLSSDEKDTLGRRILD
ncbi:MULTISPECIES: hypothetical protein [Photorhabdus]|uniref:hypothetical protein n=1 Tax=Photorhabdus sp. HUG-39 TaxID=2029680 RepID=UPI002B4B9FFF|nr:hypothetical protein [Photorhabdus bodei]